MMPHTLYKLGTLSIICILAILLGVSYFQNNSDTELLSSRINLLEKKIKQSSPSSDSSASNEVYNELANLQEKISTLQNQLTQIHSDSDNGNSDQIVGEVENLTATDTPLGDEKNSLPQESEVFTTIKNTGYLYEEDWKNLEPTLANMDKDENKLFWENMTSAIENNEIEIFSER
jgi:Tfp pilus assembly protein PilN